MTAPSIIYSRRSTDKNQKHSLKAQNWTCTTFALNNGFHVIAGYDETKSGKTLADREALQQAIAKAEETGAVIITSTISRLGRSVAEVSTLLACSKVKFIFVDLGLEADATMIMMYLVFAEAERRKISERTKRGLAQAKRNGVKLGNPRINEAQTKAAISNRKRGRKTAEQVMPMIEAVRALGITSMKGIARKLNELNFPSPQGKKWYDTSISKIIQRAGG